MDGMFHCHVSFPECKIPFYKSAGAGKPNKLGNDSIDDDSACAPFFLCDKSPM